MKKLIFFGVGIILSINILAQKECIVKGDTFKLIGPYNYDYNTFTEDTIITPTTISKYFKGLNNGKYYFTYDNYLCAFTYMNGFFSELYYFINDKVFLYIGFIDKRRDVKCYYWEKEGFNSYIEVRKYFNDGKSKVYFKKEKKPYTVSKYNGRKKSITYKAFFIKKSISRYFNYNASINVALLKK
jgi:hypothetical protein